MLGYVIELETGTSSWYWSKELILSYYIFLIKILSYYIHIYPHHSWIFLTH